MYVWSTVGQLHQVLQNSKNVSPEKGSQIAHEESLETSREWFQLSVWVEKIWPEVKECISMETVEESKNQFKN